MTYTEFQNLLVGIKAIVTADNVGDAECVDVAQLTARALNAPRFTGNAKDIINQAGTNFTQILNTPDNFPQQWDIVVFSGKYNPNTDGSEGVGHVVTCNGRADINSFDAVSQNDPLGSDIEVKTYNYDFVIGWLRPNQIPQDQQAIIDQLRTERDTNWNDLTSAKATIDNLNGITKAKDSQISTLTQQNQDLTTQLTSKDMTIQTLQEQAAKVPQLTNENVQALHDRDVCLAAQGKQNQLIANLRSQVDAQIPHTIWGRIKFILSK